MALIRSLAYSILASALATAAAHRILSVSHRIGNGDERRRRGSRPLVIIIPILVGNSNNRIGWVKEIHHHLFGRGRHSQ